MNVVLLFGGVSEEYEISLRSAAAILSAFPLTHTAIPVGIDREGGWYRTSASPAAIAADAWRENASPILLDPCRHVLLDGDCPLSADVVFPLLHGGLGEGGGVAALLELLGLPYVGCRMLAGALALDKILAKRLAAAVGIPTARFLAVTAEELADPTLPDRLLATLGDRVFVKPVSGGSSVGASLVTERAGLLPALAAALAHGGCALCEEYIEGSEVETALLERDGELLVSTVGEIEAGAVFYDYNAKYCEKTSRIFIPARIPKEARARVREYAARLFRTLGCRGLSRVDFFVRSDGSVLFNEINTMPGFTDVSMYPRLFATAGLAMPELVSVLIENAVR